MAIRQLDITIPVDLWQEIGPDPSLEDLEDGAVADPAARLLTTLHVHGGGDGDGAVFVHLEAIAVHDEDGDQVVDCDEYETVLEQAYDISGDGPLTTLTIGGREYVLVAITFAQ